MIRAILISVVLGLLTIPQSFAQESEAINWLTFEQLEAALEEQPKKVFIDFYTDWCTYCRKMDKVVFTNPEVIQLLNEDYYAVRFNAETDAVVSFGGSEFINDQMTESRNPLHQIAQLLAVREGQFVAPTMVVLDEEFTVTARYFEYLSSRRLIRVLDR